MSRIRCIYQAVAPDFPATDQAADAVRYGPFTLADGEVVFVDALAGEPTIEEIAAVLNPPAPPAPTPTEQLAAAGLTVSDLKVLLGLPT